MPSPPAIGLWHASMAGSRASTPDSRYRAAQMGRSASKTAEAEDKSEVQAKPREASLQSATAVDASALGQPGETTRSLTSRPKDEIDADGIDDLKLDASHRMPPSSPALSPIAPPTSPPMAPGVGGFNIDPPVPRANPVGGEVAIAHTRRQALPNPNPVPQAPIRAQRTALIVESGESSFIPRLLAVIAIAGVILLMFREETRKQLSDILEAARSSYKVSSAETSAYQPRLVVENQKGFANEPLPLGISVKDGSGVETLTVAGLAEGIELSLGTSQGSAGSCQPAILVKRSSERVRTLSVWWVRQSLCVRPWASAWTARLFGLNGFRRGKNVRCARSRRPHRRQGSRHWIRNRSLAWSSSGGIC